MCFRNFVLTLNQMFDVLKIKVFNLTNWKKGAAALSLLGGFFDAAITIFVQIGPILVKRGQMSHSILESILLNYTPFQKIAAKKQKKWGIFGEAPYAKIYQRRHFKINKMRDVHVCGPVLAWSPFHTSEEGPSMEWNGHNYKYVRQNLLKWGQHIKVVELY